MPHHISHDPTITEAIAAVEAVLCAHAALRPTTPSRRSPEEARAAFNGAALQLVELIAEAVEQRVARRKATADESTKLNLAIEADRIAS